MRTTIRTKRGLHTAGAAAIIASVAVIGLAAQEESLTVEVSGCVDLATPEERLACFEAQVEAARSAPAAAAAPADAAAPAGAAAPAAAGSTTAAAAAPESPSRRSERAESASAPDIFARVAELRETVPNAYLITLDNGQVWRQTQPEYYPLRQGSEVRIYAGRWGFRLTNAQLRGSIHVERAR